MHKNYFILLDQAFKEIMKHAVAGHQGKGHHHYCNNGSHANEILNKHGFLAEMSADKMDELRGVDERG